MRADTSDPSLREVQSLFYELVTAPEGVAQALRDRGEASEDLARLIVSDPALPAVDRLDIYANMYFFRILDVLRGDYPKLVSQLGDAAFSDLTTDYLLACRPAHPSLRNAGDRLPGFLRDHALGRERPWLADLAGLERRRLEVFDAADAEVLTIELLRTLDPARFAALPIRLIPAHALLQVGYSVEDLWLAIEEERAPAAVEPQSGWLVVWRNEPLVYQRRLGETELALLSSLVEGTTLGAICEVLSEGRTPEEATQVAFSLLAGWANGGLMAD